MENVAEQSDCVTNVCNGLTDGDGRYGADLNNFDKECSL